MKDSTLQRGSEAATPRGVIGGNIEREQTEKLSILIVVAQWPGPCTHNMEAMMSAP